MGRPLLRWWPTLVIASTLAYTTFIYPALPARMPIHWGSDGQVNGWANRKSGAWVLPALMAGSWLVFIAVRKAVGGIAVDVTIALIVTFEAVVQYAMLSSALGRLIDVITVIYVSLGMLFIGLGLTMPFTHRNPFVGIRTPWTLADDTVWARTHKTGGLLLVAAGALSIVAALTTTPKIASTVVIASSLTGAIGSVLLSYVYWRQR